MQGLVHPCSGLVETQGFPKHPLHQVRGHEDRLTSIRTVANFVGVDNVTDELLHNVLQHSSFLSMKKDSTSNYDWLFGPGKPIHQARTPFIRKGDIGGWKEHFTEEQSKRFDEIYQKQMSMVDLCFQFK